VPKVADLLSDLADEHASLDSVVKGAPAAALSARTPAAGWDVRDTISHLCFFDEQAALAITDPDAFEEHKAKLISTMAALADRPGADTPDVAIGRHAVNDRELFDRWRAGRANLLEAIAAADSGPGPVRVTWYGPPMSLASFTSARIMETWAHGTDIRDALGSPLVSGPRLRHVIHLGVTARPFAFAVHGVDDPGDPVAVDATTPDGDVWTWGPQDAENRISGSALDLALVFTQRRHRDRTAIRVTGPVAEQWIQIAQAFAGPPTVAAPNR
jgi:uncharacterized protein (TIGR03084 family)